MIDKNDPRLTDFVLGELNPAEYIEIQDAIADSEELQNAVEEIRQTAMLLDAAYQTEEPLSLLAEQKAEITQLQIDEAARERKPATGGRPWLPIVLAASLLGLLVGGAIYLQDPPIPPEVARKFDELGKRSRDQLESPSEAAEKSNELKQLTKGSMESGKSVEALGVAVVADETVLRSEIEKKNELQKLVASYNLAVDEGKNAEAEQFARRAQEVAPGSEFASIMNEKSRLLRRIDRMTATDRSKEEGFWSAMSNVEEASLPVDESISPVEESLRRSGEIDPQKFKIEPFSGIAPRTLDSPAQDGIEGQAIRGGSNIIGSLDMSETPNPNDDVVRGGSTIMGRDPTSASGEGDDVAGDFAVDERGANRESAQMMKRMQQQAGGGGFGGNQSLGGFGGKADFSDNDQDGGGREDGFGVAGGEGKLGGRGGMGMGMGAGGGAQANAGQSGEDSPTGESIQPAQPQTLRAMFGDKIEVIRGNEQTEAKPAPALVPMENRLKLAIDLKTDESGSQNQPIAGGKNLSDGQKSGDAEAERNSGEALSRMSRARGVQGFRSAPAKEPAESGDAAGNKSSAGEAAESEDEFSLPGDAFSAQLFSKRDAAKEEESELPYKNRFLGEFEALDETNDLGLRFEERTQRRRKTRAVPVQRTRPEIRTRKVELDNGTTKTENYTVEVPYTEEVVEEYFELVPQVVVDIEPDASRRFVEKLVKRVDPSGTREIDVKELLEKTRELNESDAEAAGKKNKDLLLASELREQLIETDGKQSDFDVSPALKQVELALKQRNAKIRQARTWKRVKAIPNTTRLMLGDKTELDLTGMQVNVQVDGFRARVLLDYFYYNDRGEQLEGNFKLRLPDDASLYYFAFGESAYNLSPKGEIASEEFLDDGTQFISLRAEKIRDARQDAWKNVKESRMVPREKAAHAYRETVRQKIDPALAEWSSAGVFNARVFPLAPKKLHRIVIGYDVNLTRVNGNWAYELDLPEQTGQCQVDINVQPVAGVEYAIEPKSDPIENKVDGKLQRRYRFEGPQKQTIRLTANKLPEMLLYSAEEFWGVQVTPELPVEKVASNPRAIFMVDTSLSSNPDKFNVWLKLLESTLESNRDSLKQFNVVFFNVDAHFWQEKWVDNTQENTQQLLEKCNTLALEGATDLYGAIEKVAKTDWVSDSGKNAGGKPLAGPDLFLFSDGAANWGETNLRLISRQLQDHQLGSLFAYQTGQTGTAISGLRFLAGQSGGAVFSVANENEIKVASTAHRKRPWKLVSITASGASDIMTAGRVQWVYPGQTITIVGRGKVQDGLKLELEQSGQTKTISVLPERVKSELASRLYGQVAVGQLESLGAKVFDVAASYARHFRVTGETCSLLMLESEAEYKRFDIKPHEDLFVIKTKEAKDLIADVLQKSSSELADPKAQLLAWLTRLETMPGMSFKMPTALKLAMDDIQVVAISKPLDCSLTSREGLSQQYMSAIELERLDYEVISTEANRRGKTSVDDAIKVFSSLVERNPGDLVIARDVAFTALEMGRPAQAYHLLRSVAKARPFEGSIYPALGQCLTQLGQSDMAIVYYEIALSGSFNRMGKDFQKIVSAEYMYLLRQIVDGKLESSVTEFAAARLETLKKNLQFETADLLITMMWNTDQTDVDLHIVEPSGEECSYENTKTRSGGQITSDITTGYGPEMYSNPEAPSGKFDIKVKYFASNQNRTEMRNKVHLTIYRGFGTPTERVTRKTVQLKTVGEKESVATVGVD